MLSCKSTCISNLLLFKYLQKWDPMDCKQICLDTFIDIEMKVCSFSLSDSKYNTVRHHFPIKFLSKIVCKSKGSILYLCFTFLDA